MSCKRLIKYETCPLETYYLLLKKSDEYINACTLNLKGGGSKKLFHRYLKKGEVEFIWKTWQLKLNGIQIYCHGKTSHHRSKEQYEQSLRGRSSFSGIQVVEFGCNKEVGGG